MSEEMGKEQVVRLNRDKELVVDISSMESLLNAINYATSKLERADALTNAEGLEKAVGRLNDNIKMLVLDEIPKFKKEQSQQFEKLPNEKVLKHLSYEIEKISGFEKAIGKIKGKHIAVTAVLTAVITMVGMSLSKYDDMFVYKFVKQDISKTNWVLDRAIYKLENNSGSRVVFTKIK